MSTHRFVLGAVLASLGLTPALSAAAGARERVADQAANPAGGGSVDRSSIPGEPLLAEAGITESVAEIMARDALLPRGAEQLVAKKEHEVPFAKQANPEALDVASWPPTADGAAPGAGNEPRLPQPVGVSFLAILGGRSGSESGYIPPDSMGAVGPTQVLAVANGRIKVFDKSGNLGALNTTTNNFFSAVGGTTNGTSDPHIRYDRLSGRWFVVIITVNNCPNNLLLAVSSGSTITNASSFTFWSFTPDAAFVDYPTLGVDKNALYMGGNIFTCAFSFSGVSAYVIRKPDVFDGGGLTMYLWPGLQGSGIWTPQGVDSDDPAATEGYFVGVDFNAWSRLGIRRISNPGTSPTMSAQINVTVPTTFSPLAQGQPSPGPTIDALDDRLFAATIHRNKITGIPTLWTAHNIRVDASGVGGSGGNRNGSRWYEIGSMSGTPTLLQAGTLFDSAATTPFGYWIPSIALSGQGHAAIGASRASTSAANGGQASISVAGRLRTDAAGATRAPTLAVASTFVYDIPWNADVPERWGDYSQVLVDPNDDQTMWTFQEYAGAADAWGLRAIQLRALPPAAPSSANPVSVAAGQASVNVVITGTSASGSEFFDPGPDTGGPGFLNRIGASISGGVTVNSATFNGVTQVTLNISTVGAPSGAKNVTITNPDGQGATGNGILTVTGGCPTITVSPSTIPAGTAGVAYSQTFTQTGGIGTIGWSLSGTLPTGMSFNSSTGVLSGTPTQTGSFPITVTATDANGCQGSVSVTLVIGVAGAFTPTALIVNASGNSVFEAGETVTVSPSWRNDTGAPQAVTGGASLFAGPGLPTLYTITDAAANYGTVAAGATASCSGTSNCYGLALGTPTTRPQQHWDSTVLETLSGGETKTWTLHVGNSFTDVPTSNGFYRFVETLLHKGVTGGCGADTYCPASSTTREQMAVFVLVSKEGAGYVPAACAAPNVFTDVPETSPYCRYIEELSTRGVVSGCGTNLYCPTDPVTREQMAIFVLRTLDPTLTPPACSAPNLFTDVPETSPFCAWIEELANRGVVTGCGGGAYCPTSSVTREQMGVFLTVTFSLALYGI